MRNLKDIKRYLGILSDNKGRYLRLLRMGPK